MTQNIFATFGTDNKNEHDLPSPEWEMQDFENAVKNGITGSPLEEIKDNAAQALRLALSKNKAVDDLVEQFEGLSGTKFNLDS